ncbi:peptidase inhibitor family I36 protein [Streptosporangium sp. NPDC000239]|uniref:Peptidase inhibitor family I36 protein n=1 Tax=Streptosporangium jomthongense TaxID=1193683 RepID=A0ABV8ETQ4_9ACTN
MRKESARLAARTLTALAVAVIAGMGALPASAAQTAPQAGLFCTYQHKDFGGARECFSAPGGALTYNDNQVSSVYNDTGYLLCARDTAGASFELAVDHGHYYKNLTKDTYPGGGSWNDRISVIEPC